jgi:hypothetical protein
MRRVFIMQKGVVWLSVVAILAFATPRQASTAAHLKTNPQQTPGAAHLVELVGYGHLTSAPLKTMAVAVFGPVGEGSRPRPAMLARIEKFASEPVPRPTSNPS